MGYWCVFHRALIAINCVLPSKCRVLTAQRKVLLFKRRGLLGSRPKDVQQDGGRTMSMVQCEQIGSGLPLSCHHVGLHPLIMRVLFPHTFV
jgi:hypothetical protein